MFLPTLGKVSLSSPKVPYLTFYENTLPTLRRFIYSHGCVPYGLAACGEKDTSLDISSGMFRTVYLRNDK